MVNIRNGPLTQRFDPRDPGHRVFVPCPLSNTGRSHGGGILVANRHAALQNARFHVRSFSGTDTR